MLRSPDIPVNSIKNQESCSHCKDVVDIPVDGSPHCSSAKRSVTGEACNEGSEGNSFYGKRDMNCLSKETNHTVLILGDLCMGWILEPHIV